MNTKYSAEIIKLIDDARTSGFEWGQVAKLVEEKTGSKVTANAVRHVYRAYADDENFSKDTTEEAMVRARKSQLAALTAKTELKKALNLKVGAEVLLQSFEEAVKKVNLKFTSTKKDKLTVPSARKTTKMTVEALFSDWQLGKLSPDFNKDIAHKRLKAYTAALLFKIQQHIKTGYQVEKIVLVLLGDIIESMDKAMQKGDASSCDLETSVQMQLAAEWLFTDLIVPLAELGIPLHVIGIPGNHDHTGPGMKMYKAGRNQISWILYKQLEILSKALKLETTFDITEGVFTTYNFYGRLAVYEHGYGLQPYAKNMQVRASDRMRQLREFVTYFRMGDKHSVTRFVEDTLVVNGAFFGSTIKDRGEEYSAVLGFSSTAAQLIFFHVDRKLDDPRNTIYDSFLIQLGHII